MSDMSHQATQMTGGAASSNAIAIATVKFTSFPPQSDLETLGRAISGDRLPFCGSDHENRNVGGLHDLVRDAAEHQSLYIRQASRAHHDEVDAIGQGGLDDRLGNMPGRCVADLAAGGDAGLVRCFDSVADHDCDLCRCLEREHDSATTIVLCHVQNQEFAVELAS